MAKKVKKTKKKTAPNKSIAKKTKAKTKKTTVNKRPKKKTVSKKTSAKKKVRRRQKTKSILTKAEINYFRDLLLKKRGEIIGDVNSIETESLRKSRLDAAGDLSSMPIHMADIGSDNFEQEFVLGLMDSERKILIEINFALKRIDEGTYGICEGTNKPITKARLEANPWARYCIEYATMLEKGLVTEGQKLYEEYKEYEDQEEFSEDTVEHKDNDYNDYDLFTENDENDE